MSAVHEQQHIRILGRMPRADGLLEALLNLVGIPLLENSNVDVKKKHNETRRDAYNTSSEI